MNDVRGDFLGPPHGTTPAAVIANKNIFRSLGSSKNTKLEDGPYCTISGNEPSSVTLYKTGSESQTVCCNFKNLHLCRSRVRIEKVLLNGELSLINA